MRPLGNPVFALAPAPSRQRGASPWSLRRRVAMLGWECCWLAFCAWTPKPLWRWRNVWLRLFGARIGRRVFVHPRARIAIPWNIALGDGACVGDRVCCTDGSATCDSPPETAAAISARVLRATSVCSAFC